LTATGSKAVYRDIRTLFHVGRIGSLGDAQLLELFLARRGEEAAEDAFAAVVERHGPMVLRVCRRILPDENDAEDAFQVTFLVLARKARAIARRELLANWLYGVAVRTAKEVRKNAARLRARERPADGLDGAAISREAEMDELRFVIDDELSRLPESFRAPVVLCDLEGKTQKEAALLLGVPVGTVSSRVARGRKLLRRRLARRGLDVPGSGLAFAPLPGAMPSGVPPALVANTARAAAQVTVLGTWSGVVPAYLAAVTEGVMKTMPIAKLTSKGMILSVILCLSIGATGVGVFARIHSGLNQPVGPGPFTAGRAADHDWSWVDHLNNADAATRERIKRCASAATTNFAAIHTLAFDYALYSEHGHVDHKTAKTTSVLPSRSHGTVYWKEGSLRYDIEGRFPFRKPYPNGPVYMLRKPKVYSVVRTRDMLACTHDNPVYGVFLTVTKPPESAEEWEYNSPLARERQLDPWLSYAPPFLYDGPKLRNFWESCRKIESEEAGGKVLLRFLGGENPGRTEVTCDGASDWLPVRVRGGEMRDGKWLVFGETVNVWSKTDGIWYPSRVTHTGYLGIDMRAVKQFDLTVRNPRANGGALVPDSVFTLSAMKIPEGSGGIDSRYQPPRGLFRAGGVVRESRPGEGPHAMNVEEGERHQAEESMLATEALLRGEEQGPRGAEQGPDAAQPAPAAGAAESAAPNAEYLSLLDEYESARRNADQALFKGQTDDDRRKAFVESGRLDWSYAPRFLEIARKYPGDPAVAIDALAALVTGRFTPPEAEQAADILIRDHLKHDRMIPVYRELGVSLAAWSKAGERLLRAAAENGPTPDARGQACLSLAKMLLHRAWFIRTLLGPAPDPLMQLEEVARAGGHEPAKRSYEDPEALSKEAAAFFDRVVKNYAAIKGKSAPLGEVAADGLFKLRELAVGRPAPEIDGVDVDGKRFRLSDYRGKVVAVSFSGNWCGPCVAMYPHERALVARMKGRPFALLGVNTDLDKETLRKSLASGEITWRSWWEGGAERPNCARWHLDAIPMVYVLDTAGIIRAKDVRGKAIDEVVEVLVKQTESRPAKAH
jgi:RNA polymerase sigma factor (sigma-70 family)